jgi:hypothetical protein
MPIEFRKAAWKDAMRAKQMRTAARLIAEMDKALCAAGIEAYTLAASIAIWDLHESAKDAHEDVLVEFEDTNPNGIQVDR